MNYWHDNWKPAIKKETEAYLDEIGVVDVEDTQTLIDDGMDESELRELQEMLDYAEDMDPEMVMEEAMYEE